MPIDRPTRGRPFFAPLLLAPLLLLLLLAPRGATSSQTASSPAYAGCRTGGWTAPAAWTRLVDQAATERGAETCLANCKTAGYDWGGFECPALGTGLVHCQCTNTFDATLAADNPADCAGARSLAHCTGPFQAGAYPLGAHSRAAVYTLSAWTPTLPPPPGPCGSFLVSGPTAADSAAGGAYVHDVSADCTVSSTVQVPAAGLSVSGPADLADRPTISGCFAAGESVFYAGHAWSTLNLSRIEIDLRGCPHSLRHVSVGNDEGAIGTALYLDHVVLRGGRAVNSGQLLATNAREVVARDSEFRDGLATSGGGVDVYQHTGGRGRSRSSVLSWQYRNPLQHCPVHSRGQHRECPGGGLLLVC